MLTKYSVKKKRLQLILKDINRRADFLIQEAKSSIVLEHIQRTHMSSIWRKV